MIFVDVSKILDANSWLAAILWDLLTISSEVEHRHLAQVLIPKMKCLTLELNLMLSVILHLWQPRMYISMGKTSTPFRSPVLSVLPKKMPWI